MLVPRAVSRFLMKVHYSTRAEIKAADRRRINKENKLIFGELLETQTERKKRLSTKPKIVNETVASVKSKARGNSSASANSEICTPLAEVSKLTSNCLETKQIDLVPVKGSSDSKGNVVACDMETSAERDKDEVPVEKSSTTSTNQVSGDVRNDAKNTSENPQPVTESFTFPIENEDKPNLQITPNTEVIVGRIITKSDSLYKYPSVTRILNLTMSEASKSALFRWRNKLIAELGEEKFQEYHARQLQLGSLFHASLQEYLQETPKDDSVLNSELEGCWKSLEKVLPRISTVKLLESHVVHEELKYRGIIDCIAVYRDTPFIIEWKKSGKSKSNLAMTYDAPLQLSAYIGALNYDSSYPFKVCEGLVVVAYSDGAPANVFRLSTAELNHNWKAWLERYKKFTDMVEIEST